MRILRNLMVLVLATVVVGSAFAGERVIIRAEKPYDQLVGQIEGLGGTVTYQYHYVNGIAAILPESAINTVRGLAGPGALRKDLIVDHPTVARDRDGAPLLAEAEAMDSIPLDPAAIQSLGNEDPDAYLINSAYMNVDPLFDAGNFGQGVKVAVIDSGYRPGFPHIDSDGSVIGGEDFVGDGLGWSNWSNGGHGTFVAGMISANVVFGFASTSTLLQSVTTHCPDCVISGNLIPMFGSAPLSSIYSLRVFPPGAGAPESRIIAAMEKVLELRENYDAGNAEIQNSDGSYDALNIQVCNMSLGGATLYAGRDFEDELTQAFLDNDVVLVVSASNAGPSGTTGGSSGTGFGALTVGASSSPVHERILRDLQFGLGVGNLYRPFDGLQTAYFSSRGPTADGRPDPDLVANGFASYGQGFSPSPFGISIASGTSFSAPSVAGVAALLRQAVPSATARQVRNALMLSADPNMLSDGSGIQDQGAGHVDGAAAWTMLEDGLAPDTPGEEGGTNVNVKVNILQGSGIKTYNGNVKRNAKGLLPGERFETYYRVLPNTSAVVVRLYGVQPGSEQNVFFGDDILLAVHSAKTSKHGNGDYEVLTFSTGGTWVIPNPETGLMRVTLNGDWTNASPIDASVQIFSLTEAVPGLTAQNKLEDGDFDVIPFTVPEGAPVLTARLEWQGNWGRYPTNDLDLILIDPNSGVVWDGATLNSPEIVEIANPESGEWLAFVDAFTIWSDDDRYELLIGVGE